MDQLGVGVAGQGGQSILNGLFRRNPADGRWIARANCLEDSEAGDGQPGFGGTVRHFDVRSQGVIRPAECGIGVGLTALGENPERIVDIGRNGAGERGESPVGFANLFVATAEQVVNRTDERLIRRLLVENASKFAGRRQPFPLCEG